MTSNMTVTLTTIIDVVEFVLRNGTKDSTIIVLKV